jgi:predicted metal-dependent hydrolase
MSDIPKYVVERSARRTIGIYVERDGSVRVRAPAAASDQRIAAIVRAKRSWVYRAQARWAALNPVQPTKEFVSGETVYFLGQPHRLDFRTDSPRGVQLVGDVFLLNREDQPQAEALLRAFYRAEGLRRLPSIVHEHASSMGLHPGTVKVLDLGHRWASCSRNGSLNFHWKAMAAPVEVLHYLAVHELAHLTHRNHSPAFWQAVEAEMPSWKRHAAWLAERGAQMTL